MSSHRPSPLTSRQWSNGYNDAMTTHVSIRAACEGDVATILGFIRELATYEKLLDQVVADEPSLKATLFSKTPAAEVLIAELGGDPVGFALFFQSYSTFLASPGLYLEDLFVLPSARSRGVGLALMSACASIAVARGYGRFEWSVLDWNEPALDFYRRLGAVTLADWRTHRLTGTSLTTLATRSNPEKP